MNSHNDQSANAAIRAATILAARRSGASSASINSHTQATRSAVRQASPNSNLRLKSIFLHSAVQRAAAQPELRGGERDVEMVHPQRALDHLPFELIEVEAFADDGHDRRLAAVWQREVREAVFIAVRHDDRAFGRMTKRANIPGPGVIEKRFEHRWRD